MTQKSSFMSPHKLASLAFLLLIFVAFSHEAKIPITNKDEQNENYKVGAGIFDITGPAAEIGMMGYAMMNQITHGVNSRLRARAFIFEAQSKVDPSKTNRVVFVSTDSCMIFHSVKQQVINKLTSLYGNLYTYENVMLSGIHTHAGPAGYAYYLLYDTSSRGFQKENFETIVNGIVAAIQMAHRNLKPASLSINVGELLESNTNRSPTGYEANPQEEKNRYKYNVDKEMTLLKIKGTDNSEIGTINWFPVHGTSMNNRNLLISGDNKGYASYLFEKYKNGNSSLPGVGPFVAAFAQANEGDVSPNTRGAFCPDGTPCDSASSTCGGYSQGCNAIGPGKSDYQSMKIIGANQFKKAVDLYESASQPVSVSVDFVHTFIDFTNITVSPQFTSTKKEGKTCPGALGDSFAAGTTDGPGDFDFTQGTNSSSKNPYWNFIASFIISDPSPAQRACQFPKPILLNVGELTFPTRWMANILPLQIFRLGDLVIVGVPGEFTTMSGRRLRETVLTTLKNMGAADENTKVVIAGLSNDYSHYIATYEEYAVQRYEAASTIFGPHTLAAYQQEFSKLAAALATGKPVPAGPMPDDLSDKTITIPFVFDFDVRPPGGFGAVKVDVKPIYTRGTNVSVEFWGANPRNNYRTQGTFLTVEKFVSASNSWIVVLNDGDYDTRMKWSRNLEQQSTITIEWEMSLDTQPGSYRIKHFGDSIDMFGNLTPYHGTSSVFKIQ